MMNQYGSGGVFPMNAYMANNPNMFGSQLPPGPMGPGGPHFGGSVPNPAGPFNPHMGGVPPAHLPPVKPPPPSMAPPNAPQLNVGQRTNASDLYSRQSRIYVGSVSSKISRDQMVSIFNSYGKVTGLSLLKGYAFVQYDTPKSARIAVARENGKSYFGMSFECNVVADEKKLLSQQQSSGAGGTSGTSANASSTTTSCASNAKGRGRGISSSTNLSSSLNLPASSRRPGATNASTLSTSGQRAAGGSAESGGTVSNLKRIAVSSSKPTQPPVKKPTSYPQNQRQALKKESVMASPPSGLAHNNKGKSLSVTKARPTSEVKNESPQRAKSELAASNTSFTSYSTDVMVCGRCRTCFSDIQLFQKHKEEETLMCSQTIPDVLSCVNCSQTFSSPWSLLQHAQKDHGYQIFKIPEFMSLDKSRETKSSDLEGSEEERLGHMPTNGQDCECLEMRSMDKFDRHASRSEDSNSSLEKPIEGEDFAVHSQTLSNDVNLDEDILLAVNDDMSDV